MRFLVRDLLRVIALGSSRIKARAWYSMSTIHNWEAAWKLLVRRKSELLNFRSPDIESHHNSPGLGKERERATE